MEFRHILRGVFDRHIRTQQRSSHRRARVRVRTLSARRFRTQRLVVAERVFTVLAARHERQVVAVPDHRRTSFVTDEYIRGAAWHPRRYRPDTAPPARPISRLSCAGACRLSDSSSPSERTLRPSNESQALRLRFCRRSASGCEVSAVASPASRKPGRQRHLRRFRPPSQQRTSVPSPLPSPLPPRASPPQRAAPSALRQEPPSARKRAHSLRERLLQGFRFVRLRHGHCVLFHCRCDNIPIIFNALSDRPDI